MTTHRTPSITTDGIAVIPDKHGKKQLVLVRRKNAPFKGMYALPGGFVNYNETTEAAVVREFKEETNLNAKIKKLVGVYSEPTRDPRGHTISVVYELDVTDDVAAMRGGDDAAEANLFYLDDIPDLAFDHDKIVEDYLCSVQNANR